MRQRSITGPLILIAIGAIFLINNLRPDLSPWTLIADYWPFLLIGAGVIGLIEVLVAVGRGCDTPPRPLGGGWVFWIVIWAVIAGVLSGHSFPRIRPFTVDGVGLLGTGYDYDLNAGPPQTPGPGVNRIVLDNIRGDVTLRGSDAGTVAVGGHKTIRAFSRPDADRADRDSAVTLERHDDAIFVRIGQPSGPRLTVTTNLDVTVPKGFSVEARSRSGDLSFENLDGGVEVTGARGDLRLSQIGGPVRIDAARTDSIQATGLRNTVSIQGRGRDVHLESVAGESTVNGDFSGTLEFIALAKPLRFQSSRSEFHVEAVPGSITMDLGDLKLNNVTGPVRFQTGTRDIEAHDVTNSLDLSVEHGDIVVSQSKAPVAKMDIHTHNGDVAVSLPDKAPFEIQGSTNQGEIESAFGDHVQIQKQGRGATIHGGNGAGAAINVTTDRGDLSLRKL